GHQPVGYRGRDHHERHRQEADGDHQLDEGHPVLRQTSLHRPRSACHQQVGGGACTPPSGVTVSVTVHETPFDVAVTTRLVGPTGSTTLTGVKRSATVSTVAPPVRLTGPSTLLPVHEVPLRAPR